jgi:DHA2 family methylenomycin A resistance protein-like MFS transporter
VDAYALTFAVLLLSAGVLGDRWGAKKAYLAGFFLFAVSSAACGGAQTVGQLVFARAVQGVGAALMIPPSLALLNHACAHDPFLRARAIGFWTAAGGVSIAAGPVVGGFLMGWLGWRSIFFVNLPVCLAGIILTLRVEETERKLSEYLDWGGQLLAIIMLTGLTGAVIEIGPHGIQSPLVIGGFCVALVSGILFFRTESRSSHPMLPLYFFRLPNFSPAVIFGVIVNLTYYGVIFLLSLYLQRVKGYSPKVTGLAFLPLTATFIFSNVFSGWAMSRFGYRWPMVAGAVVTAVAFGLLGRLSASSSYYEMLPPFLLIPLGMGFAVPTMTTTILASVDKQHSGTASAVLNAARQCGGAIGVAAFGAMAAGASGHIVHGMQIASAFSCAFLVVAAGTAALGIRRREQAPGLEESVRT